MRGLRRSNFYSGCVGEMFLRGSNFYLRGSLRGPKNFYVGPKFLCESTYFYVGQLLFTRRDYFTILQLIV